MARITIAQAATQMYQLLHTITAEAEAGKPLAADLLAEAQKVLSQADRLGQLRNTVYAASADDRDHFREPTEMVIQEECGGTAPVLRAEDEEAFDARENAMEAPVETIEEHNAKQLGMLNTFQQSFSRIFG